ncbi:hypothetical protein VTK26DRAFT_2128 [Humicola hyalothermophila]
MRALKTPQRTLRPPASCRRPHLPSHCGRRPPIPGFERSFFQTPRPLSTNKPPNPSTTTTATAKNQSLPPTQTRIDRVLARLPDGALRRYASRLRGAPVTHVAAFLVLHEITAVVPLLGLFGLFHYSRAEEHAPAPLAYVLERHGGYVKEGAARFERWFRRRGWFGFGEREAEAEAEVEGGEEGRGRGTGSGEEGVLSELWRESGEGKYRVLVEIGLAYAVTKVLLPVRIAVSVWATPWFAGVMLRARRVMSGWTK